VSIISILLFLCWEWGEPAETHDHEASVVVETDAPGESAVETEAPVEVGSGAAAGASAAAAVMALASAKVDDLPGGLRVMRGGIPPGGEIAEGSAADGSITAAAEIRGLFNLRVPAPTTPEMTWKEKRQDNEILE
jgi:hypothetical protein